jgi:peptide/nickel transport system substrate-binding protein
MKRLPWQTLGIVLLLAACAPTPSQAPGAVRAEQPPVAQPSRTLRLALRAEPISLAGTFLFPINLATMTQRRLFNAGLSLIDGDSAAQPYLAESLPQLNTEMWRVFPDGRMETIYPLRAGLTWHDGTPLAAEDFVFAWRVYTTRELGFSGSLPHSLMEQVSAPDARTIVIRWSRSFPEAGSLRGNSGSGSETEVFTPLPRHILEPLSRQDPEAFLGNPFWTTDYVGLGPFRVERWEPGAFIEAVAFDGHALGRPKIDRIRLTWTADFNATLANLLAGEVDMPADESIRVQQGIVLKREWTARNFGAVQYRPNLWRFVQLQHRPEYASPRAILDLRVRQALAHTIDRQTINDSLFEGEAILSDAIVAPTDQYFPVVDRTLVKYAFDPRRSEQLMGEAGFSRGPDGFYGSAVEGQLRLEVKIVASPQNESERTVMAHAWRSVGFNMEEGAFSPAQQRDGQALGTFRSLSTSSGPLGASSLLYYTTSAISRPENRWSGLNRGGWSNPEFDRAVEGFQTTLERDQRVQHVAQASRILSAEAAVLPLYFVPGVVAYPAGLQGVNFRAVDAEITWNIHQWEIRG